MFGLCELLLFSCGLCDVACFEFLVYAAAVAPPLCNVCEAAIDKEWDHMVNNTNRRCPSHLMLDRAFDPGEDSIKGGGQALDPRSGIARKSLLHPHSYGFSAFITRLLYKEACLD